MDSILRLPDVIAATGYSRSSIYAKVKTGDFPEPVALGAHATGWPASEISEWIDQRKTQGRAEWRARQTG